MHKLIVTSQRSRVEVDNVMEPIHTMWHEVHDLRRWEWSFSQKKVCLIFYSHSCWLC